MRNTFNLFCKITLFCKIAAFPQSCRGITRNGKYGRETKQRFSRSEAKRHTTGERATRGRLLVLAACMACFSLDFRHVYKQLLITLL